MWKAQEALASIETWGCLRFSLVGSPIRRWSVLFLRICWHLASNGLWYLLASNECFIFRRTSVATSFVPVEAEELGAKVQFPGTEAASSRWSSKGFVWERIILVTDSSIISESFAEVGMLSKGRPNSSLVALKSLRNLRRDSYNPCSVLSEYRGTWTRFDNGSQWLEILSWCCSCFWFIYLSSTRF